MAVKLAWRDEAVCAEVGPDWTDRGRGAQLEDCARCPVLEACLAFGIAIDASETVYGGRWFPKHNRRAVGTPSLRGR